MTDRAVAIETAPWVSQPNNAHAIKFPDGTYRGEANMRVVSIGRATMLTLSEAKRMLTRFEEGAEVVGIGFERC